MRSPDGAANRSMNADLPLIDISSKLIDVDREIAVYSQQASGAARSMGEGLSAVNSAYVTLTSSHLHQWQRSCQLTGNEIDLIRSV